jgi:hypothetical protein
VITSLPKSFQLSIALREPFSVGRARAASERSRIPIDTLPHQERAKRGEVANFAAGAITVTG